MQKSNVVSKIKGTVLKVDTSDENKASGKPAIVISSSNTYSAIVAVGEYELSKIKLNSEVSVYCYDTGNRYTGTIVSVGTSPTIESTYPIYESKYPVRISIERSDDLSEGSYVEVTMDDSQDIEEEGESNSLVIPLFFCKQEHGKYYVMKEENGRLKKQFLKTGKIYYGYEIVVKGGLKPEDWIALPFEKDAVDGKVCEHGELDDIY